MTLRNTDQPNPAQDGGVAPALALVHPTAEQTVIAGMIQSEEIAVYAAEKLTTEDFYRPRHQIVFQAIVNLLRSPDPLDDLAISREANRVAAIWDRKERIQQADLEEFAGDSRRARAYVDVVARYAYLRRFADLALWTLDGLKSLSDPEAMYTDLTERLAGLQPRNTARAFVYGAETIDEHAAALAQRAREAQAGKVNPFTWPWRSWNTRIRPLRPGQVGTLAMPDGMGKSTYLDWIATGWALNGAQVIHVHLEDDLEYKLDRRLARFARVPLAAIEEGKLTQEQEERIAWAQNEMAGWVDRLHYYHAPGATATQIVRELEMRLAGFPPGEVGIVIDYLDKIQPERRFAGADNVYEAQADTMERIKIFAEENGCRVFTASQGNKDMQAGGIQTRRNIRGSGQKAEKSQLVLVGTRALVTEADPARGLEVGDYAPEVTLRIDKQNRGRTGQFTQVLLGAVYSIYDTEAEG